MTEKKHVAKTIRDLKIHPLNFLIMDKSENINSTIETVKSFWNYDLMSRKPGPAYTEDGIFIGTNLDLACFLYSLLGRNAVINIPEYKTFRQTKFKEGQMLTSKDNRHGVLLGVTSNKNNFTFSVKIKDMNIMASEDVGDYRNFALTDFSGKWYDGWKTIQFLPSSKENKFITENKLWSGSSIIFKNFVHPNRWTSFFGQYYFITKLLIQRLVDERKHLNSIKKKMIEKGIEYPKKSGIKFTPKSYIKESVDKGKQIKVDSFHVEIDFPEKENSKFIEYTFDSKNLLKVTKLWRKYGKDISQLQFMTRATELAHYNTPNRFPHWLKNVKWENDYKLKGKRIKWERLVLFQPEVGKQAIAIRKRSFEKAERVSENFQE